MRGDDFTGRTRRFGSLFKKRGATADGTERIRFADNVNPYYTKLSSGFNTVRIILYMLLLVLVVVTVMCNTRLITYDNLFYMFKDINAAGIIAGDSGDALHYPSSDRQGLSVYKKGLAAVGENEISIFTASGRKTLEKSVSFTNPAVEVSDKYVLAYDRGGTVVSLYNSFARVFNEDYGYTVSGACISDSGYFAVITRSDDYNSLVKVYNSSFSLVNDVGRRGYVMDVAISDGAEYCCVVTMNPRDGDYVTEITVFIPGSDKVTSQTELVGEYPFLCSFLTSDRICIVCKDSAYIYTPDGVQILEYRYSDGELSRYCEGNGKLALVFENNAVKNKNTVNVFDNNGAVLYNKVIEDDVRSAAVCGDYLFLSESGGVSRIKLNGLRAGSEAGFIEYDTYGKKLLAISPDEVLICSDADAVYLGFDK